MKREFLQSLQVGGNELPKEIVDAIMAEHGKDIQSHKQAATQWEEKYTQAVNDHAQQLQQLRFDALVKDAVNAGRGRNIKAITALLDVSALQQSQDPAAALQEAVSKLKEENPYLFDSETTPPPYARGTGTGQTAQENYPQTLAGALKEKFTR